MSRGVARVYAPADRPDPGDFVFLSIVKVDAPAGCTGVNWLHYRIGQGPNVIDGYRRGTFDSVSEHVDTVVSALNERRTVKRGRVDLTVPSRGRTAAEKNDV